MPLISCILPTYNRRKYLPRALQNWLRQTYTNKELIIVDDGTDSIEDIVLTLSHPHVRYIRLPERATIGRKRNLAIEAARGEFIAHWDDDDVYSVNRLAEQAHALQHSRAVLCGYWQIPFWSESQQQAYCYNEGPTSLVGPTLLYRRNIAIARPFPDIDIGEDTRWMMQFHGAEVLPLNGWMKYCGTDHKDSISQRGWDEYSRHYSIIVGDSQQAFLESPIEVPSKSIVLGLISWNTKDAAVESVLELQREKKRLELFGHTVKIAVLDNGSTDGSKEALRKLKPDFFKANKTNKGSSIGRNQLIDYAVSQSADYMLFLDGDIEIIPFTVFAMVNYLANAPESIGCIGAWSGDCSKLRNETCPVFSCIDTLNKTDGFIAWTQYGLFRCSMLKEIRFIEEGPFGQGGWGWEDDDFYFQMTERGYVSRAYHGIYYLHRNRQSSCANLVKEDKDPAALYEQRREHMFNRWKDHTHPEIHSELRRRLEYKFSM